MSHEALISNVIVPLSHRLECAGWMTCHMIQLYGGRLEFHLQDVRGGAYDHNIAEDFLMLQDICLFAFKVGGDSKETHYLGDGVEIIWTH